MSAHDNLSDEITDLIDTHTEGLFVAEGMKLSVQTRNTLYDIEIRPDGFYIKGHQFYCPDWTKVIFQGSTFGSGSLLKMNWIGIGMCLERWTERDFTVTTSPVETIIRRN